MKNLEFNTEQFESNLIDGIAVVRLKASAFDIATNPRENQAFYDVFEEVSDSAATYGYVQLNDTEFERFKAFDELRNGPRFLDSRLSVFCPHILRPDHAATGHVSLSS